MGRRAGSLSVRLVAGVLASAFALLATVLNVGVASAHSQLESSVPDNGASLSQAPAEVSLTFNEALLESFPVLTVVGPDDHFWHDGEPVISGDTISVALRPLGPAGEYKVNYRVTSADGHPIDGQRTFTLTVAGTGTPGPAVGVAEVTDDGGMPLWPFIVGAVVIIGGGLAFVLLTTRRRN